jgi:hypothetical protein
MDLKFDGKHSHRWERNTRQWLELYGRDGVPLDDVAFKCDLAPDLSGIKVALLHYVAERHLYLMQMDLLSEAMGVSPRDWSDEVDALAQCGMAEFVSDVRALLTPDLIEVLGELDLPVQASLGDVFAEDWPAGLHELELETMNEPRRDALLGRWLRLTLRAKLAETKQNLRRTALGYWLARRHGSVALLREVVAANFEPFGWRMSAAMHQYFAPEKVDPRSGKRIRWSGTRTDARSIEISPIAPNGAADLWQRLRGAGQVLVHGLMRGEPILGTRRMITCPRRDVAACVDRLAAEMWCYRSDESVYRVFCGFCFMHALTETVRNVPGFLWVNRVESMPYHGRAGQCMFRWELALRPGGLIGKGDEARLRHVRRMIADPPPLVTLDSLDMDTLQTNNRHNVWDRTRLDVEVAQAGRRGRGKTRVAVETGGGE